MPAISISIVAVIVAAVVNVVIGAMWFNAPFLFQKQWLRGIGKTAEQVNAESSPMSIVFAVVGALLASLFLAVVAGWAGVASLTHGVATGLLVGAISAVSAGIKDRFEGRPWLLTYVNAGHDLVVFAVMGAVFGMIR